MNKQYYENLCKKLERAYSHAREDLNHEEAVILTKRELEDLHYLFKYEAPKIWKMKDTLSEKKIDAHTRVSMEAYEKGFRHGIMIEKQNNDNDVIQDKNAPTRLIGLENDTHKKLMGLTKFNISEKCMFCSDNESHQNPIIRFNVGDTLRLCPRCSKLYTNKDFLRLIEIICYTDEEDRFTSPDKSETVEEQSKKELHKDYGN